MLKLLIIYDTIVRPCIIIGSSQVWVVDPIHARQCLTHLCLFILVDKFDANLL